MQRNETTATSTVLLNGEQAKNQLEILEAKAKSLRKSLKESSEVGDMAGWKKYNKELTSTQREMKKVRSEAFDAKKVLDNLSGSSLKDLYSAQKKIDSLLKNGTVKRNSAEWKELADQQKLVKTEISKVNAEMSIGESKTSKFANSMNKYFTMITAGIAAVTGVVFGIKQVVQGNAELSDSFADVMKTTNLTQGEVQSLYNDFKSLNTRTARKELLQLASDAGKLGIEGKKNILDFIDAGNQIKVSLGEDLGEDAIKNIGKMVGVFSKSSKELQGLGLKEQMLAVGSAVNSIGQNSSASEEYLVAFAARLGGVSKQAGIGIDQILGYASALDQDMQQVEMAATALQNFIMKIMADPAKFAKIAGLEVKSFSKLLDTDANAAIKKVLRALNEKGGFQALIPIFEDMGLEGSRAVGVLSSLAGSIDKIDKEQLLANKSLAEGTSITKEYNIRNTNLAASLSKLNQNISTWFKNSTLTSWLGQIVSGMEKATSTSKSFSEQFEEQSKKVLNLKLKIEPLLTRYDELNSKTTISTAEHRELKKIIAQVTEIMPGATTAVDKYGNALSISTDRVREFINAEVARLGVVNRTAIYEAEKELKATKEAIANIKKTIDEINKTGTYSIAKSYGEGDTKFVNASEDEVLAIQNRYKELINNRIGYEAEIKRLSGATLKKQMDDVVQEQKLLDEKAAKEKAYYKMSKAELQKLIKLKDELAIQVYNDRWPKEIVPEGKKLTKEELYDKDLKLLEEARKDEELVNKKAYADETVNEEVFREWQYQAKLEFLAKKLALDKKYKKDTTATEAEIADAIISENEYWNNKIIQEAEKLKKDEQKDNKDKEREVKEHLERIAQIRREFGLNTLRLTYSQELELLKEKLAEEKASEEETAMAIADFKKRVAEDYVNDYAAVAGKASAALNNLVEMETIAIETKYAKEIEAAEKAGKDTTELQERSEREKKDIKKKYALIDFLITNSRIVAETAAAIMKAAPNVPLQIAEGILGATQLGIATAEYNSVKNLWTGGFTDPGDKYKPAGIVHAGEFVANQDAVGNRTLRRLFNVIDYAQKNNTVGRIDSSTIARALQMKQGFSSGGFTAPGTTSGADVQVINYAEVVSALHSANAVNSALLAELQKGIRAKVAIRGSEGLEETTELYDKLMTNVTKK